MTSNPHREGRFIYRGFVYRGVIALGVGVDSTTFTLNKRYPE